MALKTQEPATSPQALWIQQGLAHQQAGRFDEAGVCYRRILELAPEHADALHLLGSVHHAAGHHEAALALIRRAVDVNGAVWAYHHNLGEVLRALRRFPEALDAYQQALRLHPDHFETQLAMAIACQDAGNFDDACRHYGRALTLQPRDAGLHHRLGIALCMLGKLDEAVQALQRATALTPTDARVHHDLGVALVGAGRVADAAVALNQAITLKPDFVAAYLRLGAISARQGRLEEALRLYRTALDLAPDDVDAAEGVARTLEKQGDANAAIRIYRDVIDRHGHSEVRQFNLASLGAAAAPAAAPPSFVVSLFDQYAEHFDSHLANLQYRTPQLLFEAVSAVGGTQPCDVLDLGCGTGLCGLLFKPLATTLVGVDLSPKMLDKARQRALYDRLLVGDVCAALLAHEQAFDLILAADVWVYFGDLTAAFRGVAGALRPGGLFAFSVEAMAGDGYALCPTRRYTHSLAYLRQLAAAHHLQEVSVATATQRRQARQDVVGLIVVLRRAPASAPCP